MIIVQLTGGLGNQMFQYAFGRSRSRELGVELALDISKQSLNFHTGFELDRLFNIKTKIAGAEDIHMVSGWKYFYITRKLANKLRLKKLLIPNLIEEPHYHLSQDMLYLRDNIIVSGYWQSEQYFLTNKKIICNDFTFKLPLSDHNRLIADKLGETNSISIHIRRNDYVKNPTTNAIHGACSIDYYQDAINYMIEHVQDPEFFVFSDDINWASKNLVLDHPCQFISHNQGADSYIDMQLMSLCKHNIIANSTFSWWGAWLNQNSQNITIAPQNWFVRKRNTQDLYPNSWISF